MVKRSWGVLLDTEKHSPSMDRDDSSASTAWRPFCSCGWSGIAIFATVEINDLQEIFQKFVEKHGIDSMLPSDAIFGNENDALIQILHHIGYNPEEDESSAIGAMDAAVEALKNYDVRSDGSHELYDLTSEFPRIVETVADQKRRSFVWRTVTMPKLRKNGTEAELTLRQYLIAAWESQQTD